jgi:DNA-nicking Smr family endonuclease
MENKDSHPMEKWLKDFPPPSAAEREKENSEDAKEKKFGLFPAKLDLHGMTRDTARRRLQDFIRNSARGGLRKVLVIHGKGLNSEGEAVLPQLVRTELERNPFVVDFGAADLSQGGAGALEVFLRQRSR